MILTVLSLSAFAAMVAPDMCFCKSHKYMMGGEIVGEKEFVLVENKTIQFVYCSNACIVCFLAWD
jgi:hypothetical protein